VPPEAPVSKEVRTAAYQALSTMPGVRSLGKIRDARGRIGEGLSFILRKQDTSASTIQVIVDMGALCRYRAVVAAATIIDFGHMGHNC
jgi:hypothetical protein